MKYFRANTPNNLGLKAQDHHLIAIPKYVANVAPYDGLGKAGTSYGQKNIEGIDVNDIMLKLAGDMNTNWLFWFIRKHINNKTNTVVIEPSSLTSAEVLRLKRAYPVLEKLNWVKRYKNKHYIVNPKVMIPRSGYLAYVCNCWFEITGEHLGSYSHSSEQARYMARNQLDAEDAL